MESATILAFQTRSSASHSRRVTESRGTAVIENVEGHSVYGSRSLAIRYNQLAAGRVVRVATTTFIPPEAIDIPRYQLMASPTL